MSNIEYLLIRKQLQQVPIVTLYTINNYDSLSNIGIQLIGALRPNMTEEQSYFVLLFSHQKCHGNMHLVSRALG